MRNKAAQKFSIYGSNWKRDGGEAVWGMLADSVPDTQNVRVLVMASLCIHNLLIFKDKKIYKKMIK